MKKNYFILLKKRGSLMIVFVMLLLASCVDGYKDDLTFSSGVENTQLESPKAEDILIKPDTKGKELTVSWPVVYGAGGYMFSIYNLEDPDNPVLIGEENQIVDGCSVTREVTGVKDDSSYKVIIKTLGDEKLNNKTAETATEAIVALITPTYYIPAGSDLTAFFEKTTYEITSAFELEGGAEYTMSGDIKLKAVNVIIRGDEANHAKVKITTSGAKFISAGAGMKFKFLDFDLSGTTAELINYIAMDPSMPTTGSQPYSVANPVLFEGCHATGMTYRLISGGSGNFFISSVIINNCIFDMKLGSTFIQFGGNGHIKDFEITATTFNNDKEASPSQRFLQYGNGNISKGALSASLTMTNNTFYNVSYTQAMANYNMMRQKTYTVTAMKNIFVDCGNQKVISGFVGGNGSPVRVCNQNAYWYNGAFPTTETSDSNGDNGSIHFEVDPGFADPATGKFTISASALIDAGIGDPRWIP